MVRKNLKTNLKIIQLFNLAYLTLKKTSDVI